MTVDDVKRLLADMRAAGISDSTRAKHARVLAACLVSAVESGYAGRNVVRALRKGERPRAAKKESAYFEANELVRLFAKVELGLFAEAARTAFSRRRKITSAATSTSLLNSSPSSAPGGAN